MGRLRWAGYGGGKAERLTFHAGRGSRVAMQKRCFHSAQGDAACPENPVSPESPENPVSPGSQGSLSSSVAQAGCAVRSGRSETGSAHGGEQATGYGPVRGRLAPSPTGYMHLGNIWSFLLCWLAVRSRGGALVLRMEDIDPDRSRPEYAEGIMRDLAWLGLDWDEGPDVGGPYGPYVQSERYDRYAAVLEEWQRKGHVYPCFCTRKELRALASAPHAEDCGPAYPGLCLNMPAPQREAMLAEGRRAALRLHWPEGEIVFDDLFHGRQSMTWEACGGDFAVRRSDGVFAYQLAVAVDDADQHITQVVRGDDILHCTPRQIVLHRLLGAQPPVYAHVPLVHDHEGARLAKRHRHFEAYLMRESGVLPEAVIGYLAYRAGLQPECAPARPELFIPSFRLEDVPRAPVMLEADIADRLLKLSASARCSGR